MKRSRHTEVQIIAILKEHADQCVVSSWVMSPSVERRK
jgi:hypothetical protein